MSQLISGIAKLSPFSKRSIVDDDDKGEAIDQGTVAGGGHASRESAITKDQLRVSRTIRNHLLKERVISEAEAGLDEEQPTIAMRELLDKPHINVPKEVLSRHHPLPNYFISSSHNTYLTAHQLFGESHAVAYEIALNTGSRCVEIDAWDNSDNKDEPKVTHGYTLVSHIPFRDVCETIAQVIDKEASEGVNAAPIMISLENHCDAQGQLRLAQIMREVFGHRLLSKAVRDKGTREEEGTGEHVTLAELGNKVVVIVEYHLPDEADSSDSEDSSADDETTKQQHQQYHEDRKKTNSGIIIPELAELGVYAQSVKPVNNSVSDAFPTEHTQFLSTSYEEDAPDKNSNLPIQLMKLTRKLTHNIVVRRYPPKPPAPPPHQRLRIRP
ncbi:unnamed protein product [Periconia digitata]|uniref:Phosphoinositide phospholipase C n=1 Tax=Periconia digitata TaxID=1303443 RepID=A0A9W4UTS9_9PLEO|nr:unnamed protein product [Periconia digitata]